MAAGRWMWLVIVAAMVLTASQAVHAQEPARLALLIGNQGYAAKVGALKNPHTDVALIEAALTKLGFKVAVLKDANHRAMDTAIKRHVREVNRAGAGALSFFYYSGHGVANPETKVNYLIPVDVTETEDEKIWDEAYQQNAVIDLLSQQAPRATHFVVFDACRNELNITGPAAKSLGADKGFVPIQNTAGLLIAYATAPGKTASDVGAGGGPYATALADELVKPGVEAVSMFRAVQIRVKQAINQDPWLSFPSLPPTFLAGQAQPDRITREQVANEAALAWMAIKDSTNTLALEAFRRRFSETAFADFATARVEELNRATAASKAEAERLLADLERKTAALTKPSPVACDGINVDVAGGTRKCIKPGSGKTTWFKDCPTCPEMVVVPTGTFTMGSTESEPGRLDREDQVQVTFSKPLAVGRFAVTRGEFASFVADTGHKTDGGCHALTGTEWKLQPDRSWRSAGFAQDDRHPVVCVNWDDAKAYAAWLSAKTGKTYRLMSESEREYVTRAGTPTPFWWGVSITSNQANFNGSAEPYKIGGTKGEYRQRTVPVDSFEANPWGLYNVHGNVWEWTEDCWNGKNAGNPGNGSARTSRDCSSRVLRGGSWSNVPQVLRAADRYYSLPVIRSPILGFRMARTLP